MNEEYYEKIALSRPVNKQTGITTSKGETFSFDLPEGMYCCTEPLETTKWRGDKRKNQTGKRYGRVVIIGFLGVGGRGRNKWLYRCDCGNFGTGKIKGINHPDFECYYCKKMKAMKTDPSRELLKEEKKKYYLLNRYGQDVLDKYLTLSTEEFDLYMKILKGE